MVLVINGNNVLFLPDTSTEDSISCVDLLFVVGGGIVVSTCLRRMVRSNRTQTDDKSIRKYEVHLSGNGTDHE